MRICKLIMSNNKIKYKRLGIRIKSKCNFEINLDKYDGKWDKFCINRMYECIILW